MSAELDDLLQQFRRLVEENSEEAEPEDDADANNFRCVDCVDCIQCRFCTNCERCEDCTYCEDAIDCKGCTQGRGLYECTDCTQTVHSAYCEASSYLVLCYGCRECVHCFACVGLEGAEFCVLNEQLSRRDYFRRVARLRAELDEASRAGWCPPWLEEDDGAFVGSEAALRAEELVARGGSTRVVATEEEGAGSSVAVVERGRAQANWWESAGAEAPAGDRAGRSTTSFEADDELWEAFDLPPEEGLLARSEDDARGPAERRDVFLRSSERAHGVAAA